MICWNTNRDIFLLLLRSKQFPKRIHWAKTPPPPKPTNQSPHVMLLAPSNQTEVHSHHPKILLWYSTAQYQTFGYVLKGMPRAGFDLEVLCLQAAVLSTQQVSQEVENMERLEEMHLPLFLPSKIWASSLPSQSQSDTLRGQLILPIFRWKAHFGDTHPSNWLQRQPRQLLYTRYRTFREAVVGEMHPVIEF